MSADWVTGKLLGEGANGKAFLAHRRDYLTGEADLEAMYVIKQVFIGDETVLAKSTKLRETQLLAMIRHPYIVQYEDSFVEDGHLFVAMEFAGGGTLERYTEPDQCKAPCHPTMVKSLFVQMALAVAYLHARKIVHRDLKPANVFLREDGCVKLGDLGEGWLRNADDEGLDPAARWENDPQQQGQIVGTPYYLSPECWMGKCRDADKADVWALGVTLYELCTLQRPWDAKSVAGLAQRIVCDPCRPPGKVAEPGLMEAVDAMLVKDPEARLSCMKVLESPVFERAMALLHVPEHEWDPTFGKEAPRQAMPPSSFLFQWGLRSFRPQCVEALLHKNIKEVSVGRYHIAATSVEGELFTWSMITGKASPDDAHAGLGHGSSSTPCRLPSMVRSEELEGGEVVLLDLDETLFVSVACGDRISPLHRDAGGDVQFMAVTAGSEHALALSSDGDVYSWGCGESGRTGHGHEKDTCTPTRVRLPAADWDAGRGGGLVSVPEGAEDTGGGAGGGGSAASGWDTGRDVMHVSCGEEHSAAVTFEGALYVWGANEGGRLGVEWVDLEGLGVQEPSGDFVHVPVQVRKGLPIGADIVDAACGARHTAALVVAEGRVQAYAWGEGMALDGDGADAGGGGGDDGARFFANVQEAGGGMYNSDDEYGDGGYESDDGKAKDPQVPTLVGGPKKGMAEGGWGARLGTIAAGEGFCAALTEDLVLHMWGVGDAGQLGFQAPSGVSCMPRTVEMPLPLAILHVACGAQTSFAVGMPRTEEAQKSLGRVITAEVEEGTTLAKGKSSRNLMA